MSQRGERDADPREPGATPRRRSDAGGAAPRHEAAAPATGQAHNARSRADAVRPPPPPAATPPRPGVLPSCATPPLAGAPRSLPKEPLPPPRLPRRPWPLARPKPGRDRGGPRPAWPQGPTRRRDARKR